LCHSQVHTASTLMVFRSLQDYYNMVAREAQLWNIGAQYFLWRGSVFLIRGRLKLLPKLWNIGKGCIFTIRIDKLLLSTIEIRSLSCPKSSLNLSSDRLETKYERLTSIQRILYFQGKRWDRRRQQRSSFAIDDYQQIVVDTKCLGKVHFLLGRVKPVLFATRGGSQIFGKEKLLLMSLSWFLFVNKHVKCIET